MVSVTGIVSGCWAPDVTTVMVPLYVPGVKPVGFAVTVSVAGRLVPPATTESQLPVVVPELARKLTPVTVLVN
jgi:hypothetical protein